MNLDNMKILVVDDEKEICEYMASYLKRKGYLPSIANSAETALPAIKEESPDIILLDICLPGMNGIDLLRLIRKFNVAVKVVIISGYSMDFQYDPQVKGLGISEFIEKPMSFGTLDLVLEKIAQGQL